MSPGRPGGAAVANRSRWLTRQLVAVALCALATHAAVYGTLEPHGSAHRYFVWYAPLVVALSSTALLVLPLMLVISLLAGRGSRPARLLALLLPTRSTQSAMSSDTFKLASFALVFLTVQESLERSLATSRFVLAGFAPGTVLVLVAVVLVTAAIVVLVERAICSFAESIRRDARSAARRPARLRWQARLTTLHRRRRPLALNRGLRAPPVVL